MNIIGIPKRLFFIWFGDEIPDFVDFSIENHRKVNKNFQVVFIRRTIQQLENILLKNITEDDYDTDIKKSWNVLHDKKSVYFPYVTHQKSIYGDKIRTIQVLGDILRVILVNEHGGIYLDCDTFPMKPMDDLVSRRSFVVQRYYRNGNLWFDNYFMGSNGIEKIIDPINDQNRTDGIVQTDKNWYNGIDYISNKMNFFKCNGSGMKTNEKYYIEHYYRSDWRCADSNINMLKNGLDRK